MTSSRFEQTPWHALDTDQVVSRQKLDWDSGLREADVTERRDRFGPNTLTEQKGRSPLMRLLLQFHNPLIYILLVAGVVTFFLREYVDSGVILAVVIINALIGYLQEAKAAEAIGALRQLLTSQATVIRNGVKTNVPAADLVPGDRVLLASGDKVPADLRLIRNRDLQVDESALTGESVASQKHIEALPADTVLADRANLAFAGTLVTYGTAEGVVVATGDATETGRIAGLMHQSVNLQTPLTRKIERFSKVLLWIILALAAVTFLVGILRGDTWQATFVAAVALSVAAIPEGLPAVVTITLAIGVRRMARANAIVRKLPAVETLGSTTVICSDKTGTLTENQMTVLSIAVDQGEYTLTGNGYHPEGTVSADDGESLHTPSLPEGLRDCLLAGLLCNDSDLIERDGNWSVRGDPTEGALLTAAAKAGFDIGRVRHHYPRLDVVPFESERQYMATLNQWSEGRNRLLVKGSLEAVLARCSHQLKTDGTAESLDSEAWHARANRFAEDGLRVLAVAWMEVPEGADSIQGSWLSDPSLTMVGVQAMMDPPREEAIKAVAECQRAGIQIKMITGDHALTARAIAARIGFSLNDQAPPLTGRDIARLSDAELTEKIGQVSVFARVAPEQKLRLVHALQGLEHVVAMTGDGVNDAPALRQADIGVAMGRGGTEVAREAADMVLADDNFASIERAVGVGRNVYDNLVKFITWVLPTNIGQGLVIMLAILLGVTLPVLPVQALWLNMTAAIFLGLMLAFEPREAGLMERPPRPPQQFFLTVETTIRIMLAGLLLLLGAFGLFEWALHRGESIEEARTLAVTLFVVVQTTFLFNCRSLTRSLWRTPVFSNPWVWAGTAGMLLAQLAYVYTPLMNLLFDSAPFPAGYWVIMGAYGLATLVIIEAEKAWQQRRTVDR